MPKLTSRELCSGCTACKAVCPSQAITMQPDKDGFTYPVIDLSQCVQCHACERSCPVLNPFSASAQEPICFAAKTKNEEVRRDSSSGGIFTELAKMVIKQNGVVFGCIWQLPEIKAVHGAAANLDELKAMRRSKYVQSDLRDTLKECKRQLQNNRCVLFSGTPCQIAGLNHFLGRKYQNLVSVEVICHGVPAPHVFEAYKEELEKQVGQPLRSFASRNKHDSWRRSSFSASVDAEKEILLGDIWTNPYGRAFIHNLCLRSSCYACACKGGKSQADITLADFWGIETVFPQFDDDRGTSAVMLHSEQGKRLWSSCCAEVESIRCMLSDIHAQNSAYAESVSMPQGRSYFMNHYGKKTMAQVVDRSLRGPWVVYILRKIVRRMKRFVA